MLNVSIKSVIVSMDYGKEGNMPQSDILNNNLKMRSILHHSKMYPFESGIFKFQGRRLCWENCVSMCVWWCAELKLWFTAVNLWKSGLCFKFWTCCPSWELWLTSSIKSHQLPCFQWSGPSLCWQLISPVFSSQLAKESVYLYFRYCSWVDDSVSA